MAFCFIWPNIAKYLQSVTYCAKNNDSDSFSHILNTNYSILNEYFASCQASADSSFEPQQGVILIKMLQNVF